MPMLVLLLEFFSMALNTFLKLFVLTTRVPQSKPRTVMRLHRSTRALSKQIERFIWGLLFLLAVMPEAVLAGKGCPYPKPGLTLASLPLFITALLSWLHSTNPPRALAQGIAEVISNLPDMDPRVAQAWMAWAAIETAAGRNPYDIPALDFQSLIGTAIRNPSDLFNTMDA